MSWLSCMRTKSCLSPRGYQNSRRRARNHGSSGSMLWFDSTFYFSSRLGWRPPGLALSIRRVSFCHPSIMTTQTHCRKAIMDRIAVVSLSFVACVIMSIMLPWCQLCNLPLVQEIFNWFSSKFGNNLSLVNARMCVSSIYWIRKLTYDSISNDIWGDDKRWD